MGGDGRYGKSSSLIENIRLSKFFFLPLLFLMLCLEESADARIPLRGSSSMSSAYVRLPFIILIAGSEPRSSVALPAEKSPVPQEAECFFDQVKLWRPCALTPSLPICLVTSSLSACFWLSLTPSAQFDYDKLEFWLISPP